MVIQIIIFVKINLLFSCTSALFFSRVGELDPAGSGAWGGRQCRAVAEGFETVAVPYVVVHLLSLPSFLPSFACFLDGLLQFALMRVLFLLLAILAAQNSGRSIKSPISNQPTSGQGINDSQRKESKELQPSLCINCTVYQYPQPQENHERGHEDEITSRLYRKYLRWTVIGMFATVVGVIGGLVGLWAIWCQTKAARKAADAAKESAQAAQMNAQAVINSERPWIVITVSTSPDKEGLFVFRATNKGKTPADIVSGYCDIEFFSAPIDGVPEKPRYEHPIIAPPENFVMTNEGFDINHGINPEAVIDHDGKRQALEGARAFLCVYGEITYRDVFREHNSEAHHTRWFYVYDFFGKRMEPSGPNAYSEKT